MLEGRRECAGRGAALRKAQRAGGVKTARKRAASASERVYVLTPSHQGGGAPQASARVDPSGAGRR